MNLDAFAEFTSQWEGFSSVAYDDSRGIPTIGYGFNLARRDAKAKLAAHGMDLAKVLARVQTCTREAGARLLAEEMTAARDAAARDFHAFHRCPRIVQFILADLVYNMGADKVQGFNGFCDAIRARDWATAAAELMFRTVGKRDLTGYFLQTKQRAHHNVSALLKLHKDKTP